MPKIDYVPHVGQVQPRKENDLMFEEDRWYEFLPCETNSIILGGE
jgi:hypothetical protein